MIDLSSILITKVTTTSHLKPKNDVVFRKVQTMRPYFIPSGFGIIYIYIVSIHNYIVTCKNETLTQRTYSRAGHSDLSRQNYLLAPEGTITHNLHIHGSRVECTTDRRRKFRNFKNCPNAGAHNITCGKEEEDFVCPEVPCPAGKAKP